MKLTKFFREKFTLPAILGVTEQAEEERNRLALAATRVTAVTSPEEQQVAAVVAGDIQTYVKAVEKMGLDFRRPLNDAAAMVKRTQDDHLAPLLAEKARVGRLLADFADKEARRVAQEEEERRRAYDEAEANRIELERRASEAAESGKVKTAEKLQAKADAAEATVQAVIAAPLPTASKASGVATKKVLRYEVLDAAEVYRHRPELVKLEVKASAVQACCVPEVPVPGLKLWWETVAVVSRR